MFVSFISFTMTFLTCNVMIHFVNGSNFLTHVKRVVLIPTYVIVCSFVAVTTPRDCHCIVNDVPLILVTNVTVCFHFIGNRGFTRTGRRSPSRLTGLTSRPGGFDGGSTHVRRGEGGHNHRWFERSFLHWNEVCGMEEGGPLLMGGVVGGLRRIRCCKNTLLYLGEFLFL